MNDLRIIRNLLVKYAQTITDDEPYNFIWNSWFLRRTAWFSALRYRIISRTGPSRATFSRSATRTLNAVNCRFHCNAKNRKWIEGTLQDIRVLYINFWNRKCYTEDHKRNRRKRKIGIEPMYTWDPSRGRELNFISKAKRFVRNNFRDGCSSLNSKPQDNASKPARKGEGEELQETKRTNK